MSERRKYEAVDFKAAVERFEPDVAIIDANAWGAIFSAEAWGGPWALFFPYPVPLQFKDVPPFGPGLQPARGPLGPTARPCARPILIGSLERELMPSVNAVRDRVGLGDIRSVDDMFGIAPLVLSTAAYRLDAPARICRGMF